MKLLTDEEIASQSLRPQDREIVLRVVRALEAKVLERLAVGFVEPEPEFDSINLGYGRVDAFSANQLRAAFAAGAASQLSAEPAARVVKRGMIRELSDAPIAVGEPLYIRKGQT